MREEIVLSLIIPIYNAGEYLPQCLDSVLSQSLPQIEIICVNDCSTDNSLEILQKYAEQDSRIVIINNSSNKKAGATRNAGIDHARGKYIHFLDSDDWIVPDLYEKMVETCERNNLDIVVFSSIPYDQTTNSINTTDLITNYINLSVFDHSYDDRVFSGKSTKDILFEIVIAPWSKIYRTSLLQSNNIRFPENIFYEDTIFFYDAWLAAQRIMICRENLLYYRINTGTSLTDSKGESIFDMFRIFDLVEASLKKYGIFAEVKHYFWAYQIHSLNFHHVLIKQSLKEEYQHRLKKRYNRLNLSPGDLALCDSYRQDVTGTYANVVGLSENRGNFLFKKTKKAGKIKYRLLGIPLYQIKYVGTSRKHYLLGIKLRKIKSPIVS